jgi:hypothetical protein
MEQQSQQRTKPTALERIYKERLREVRVAWFRLEEWEELMSLIEPFCFEQTKAEYTSKAAKELLVFVVTKVHTTKADLRRLFAEDDIANKD